ncbi:hypothetical protein Sango_2430000 [Sesamum angolense]|uniref:Uncharacterized protein n=1 Tax=Sesamum angolense TaxID=2727404 RepID=A0AAE2BK33_9LAMI|nr:hypothetical protein Sango_2430000 [Sesamum angolense]
MQFPMGLHDVYDYERSQILMMDPLLDVEKAYSMVLSVEKQRSVNAGMIDSSNNTAYHLAVNENRRGLADKNQRRKQFIDKRSRICENCLKPGHSKESCFKLHAYQIGTRL